MTAALAWPDGQRIVSRPAGAFTAFTALVDTPEQVEELLEIEAMTNPLARDAAGILATIPPPRRYGGPLAGLIMTPFVLPSVSRFSDGKYGVLYVANIVDVALHEAGYHHTVRLLATHAPAGTTVPLYALDVDVAAALDDVRSCSGGDPQIYHPDSYAYSSTYGAASRAAGNDGVHYDSVRHAGGECVGLFWPVGVRTAQTAAEYRAVFDGVMITEYSRVVA